MNAREGTCTRRSEQPARGANKGASANSTVRNCHNNRNYADCDAHRDPEMSISLPFYPPLHAEFTTAINSSGN